MGMTTPLERSEPVRTIRQSGLGQARDTPNTQDRRGLTWLERESLVLMIDGPSRSDNAYRTTPELRHR